MQEPNSDDKPTPFVTVITANHNYGQFIADAIRSVVEQDYPRKGMIIVDDGSKDDSVGAIKDILSGYSERTDGVLNQEIRTASILSPIPITLLYYENSRGPSTARNIGIEIAAARTDIFSILDADDYYKPTKLSRSVEKFLANPMVGLVYTDNETLRVEHGLIQREFRESFSYRRLFNHNPVCSAFAVSKAALQAVGLYDPSLRCAEDLDLIFRVSQKFGVVHIPESLLVMRRHPENSDRTVRREVWEDCWRRIGEKLRVTEVAK